VTDFTLFPPRKNRRANKRLNISSSDPNNCQQDEQDFDDFNENDNEEEKDMSSS
jgi:hypothetical protein